MGQASSSRRKGAASDDNKQTPEQQKSPPENTSKAPNTQVDGPAKEPAAQQQHIAPQKTRLTGVPALAANSAQGGWVVEKISKASVSGQSSTKRIAPATQTTITTIKPTKQPAAQATHTAIKTTKQPDTHSSHLAAADQQYGRGMHTAWVHAEGGPGRLAPTPHKDPEAELETLMNGSRSSGYALFSRHDRDRDGFLSRKDLHQAFLELRLNLSTETYNQFVHCNFIYADRDRDGFLSFDDFLILYHLICDMKKKFKRYDLDQDGYINKQDFTNIVSELNLSLDPTMLKEYVNLNFRFADRNFKGTISFGQFLTGYANFLYSYEVTNNSKAKTNTAAASGSTWAAAEGDVLL